MLGKKKAQVDPGAEVAELKARLEDVERRLEDSAGEQARLGALIRDEVSGLRAQVLLDVQAKQEAASEELRASLSSDLRESREAADAGVAGIRGELDAVLQEVQAVRSEAGDVRVTADEGHRLAGELRVSVDAAVQELSQALESRVAEAEGRLSAAVAELRAKTEVDMLDRQGQFLSRCEVLQGGLDSLAGEIRETRLSGESSHAEHAQKVGVQLEALKADCQRELETSLREAEAAKRVQLAAVDREVAAQGAVARRTLSLAENVFTRTVVWQARGFKRRLAGLLETDEQLIRSPGFSLSSLPEMRLEVRLASMADAPEPSVVGPPLPLAGSCSIGVWAPAGLHLAFRVTLGDGPLAVSRRYEHGFRTGGQADEASRSLFFAQNFCKLSQVWVRETDSVKVSFDLLEFQTSPVPALPSPTAPLAQDDGAGADAGASDAPCENGPVAVDDSLEYIRVATAQEVVHDRLSSELAAVKNRSVRRIEWKLEGCSRLLECRVGEAIDSPVFSAAGLERVQFHFYPRDVSVSGSNAQPCAFYVSGPSRTTLRGMLWVGTSQRSLEHRYSRRGDTAGRTRFCVLENQVDCNDSVVLAFDIAEVETELPDQASVSLCLRDARPAPGGAAPGGGPAAGGTSPVAGTRASLRTKRDDPSKTEEFVKCVSLPTLNARQLKLPPAVKGPIRSC